MAVNCEKWGDLSSPGGQSVYRYEIPGEQGVLTLTNYGAAVTGLTVFGKNVILGYDTPIEYAVGKSYQGATIGRYANRIKGGFTLDGKYYPLFKNNGECNLHGADDSGYSYDKKVWQGEISGDNSVTFKLHSPDGDAGFPGNLDVSATYSWDCNAGGGALRIEHRAVTDAPTPVNLTNHSYFNLAGDPAVSVEDSTIYIDAYRYNESLDEVLTIDGTAFDLRKPTRIGDCVSKGLVRLVNGYDHNFVLNSGGGEPQAEVFCPASGIKMSVATDMPCMQFYTACNLSEVIRGVDLRDRGLFSAFCLETQFAPNTPNAADASRRESCILKPGDTYSHYTVYRFSKIQ
ncbi:aldose 1-epimerase [Clostridia bacterium]|nr:aldose 1-epimerase [Clostridia bacterium]